jgi:ADP-heptose:LPS heptosyltransferase
MGDVAMTIPVIRTVIEQHPKVKISILTKPIFLELFREFKKANLIAFETKGRHSGLIGIFRLKNELKELNIDAIIDLHNVLRTNFLKFLWGRNFHQIDKGRRQKTSLINGTVFKQIKTTHQRYLDVFNKLNMNVSIAKPVFPKKTNLEKYNKKVIIDSNKKLIGIAPFAKHEAKTYSFEKMKRVIEYVSEEHIILLFGGGEIEGKLLGKISENNKNVFSLVNGFTLSDQMDFMSNLNLMISMDSANGHLAAMYGVKVITIWGVTHPYAGFLPFNQNTENSIMPDRKKYPKIPTSIYGDKYPEGYKNAINSISTEEIIQKIKEIL